MSETGLFMHISHRNDENGRLELFRSFGLCHASCKYLEISETIR